MELITLFPASKSYLLRICTTDIQVRFSLIVLKYPFQTSINLTIADHLSKSRIVLLALLYARRSRGQPIQCLIHSLIDASLEDAGWEGAAFMRTGTPSGRAFPSWSKGLSKCPYFLIAQHLGRQCAVWKFGSVMNIQNIALCIT